MENYNVDYFIKKFEAIPEELWYTGSFKSPDLKRACALGHCRFDSTQSAELIKLLNSGVGRINDGLDVRYQQPTPKQRILAALYDIKKAQTPTIENTVKVVYVTVDESVRELQEKELSVN